MRTSPLTSHFRDKLLAWARESTCLHYLFPQWIKNRRESIIFLSDVAAYEDFCKHHKISPQPLNVIEETIRDHKIHIEVYEQILEESNIQAFQSIQPDQTKED